MLKLTEKIILENGGVKINEELHQYLLSLGQCKFIGVKEDKIYTILDKNFFEKVVLRVDPSPQTKSELEIIKEKIAIQEQSLLELSMLIGGAK